MIRAKKHLGQHFLRSTKALEAIVGAGDVKEGDTALEIGPGKGILTAALLARGARVVAVEKDLELAELLHEKFKKEIREGALTLVRGDILKFDPSAPDAFGSGLRPPTHQSGRRSYKLISNIPYYITGQIIEKFLTARRQPERMVLLLQKEVGERIVAKNGKESILSLSVKAYGDPKVVKRVSRKEFTPPPKVDSVVLLVTNISRKNLGSVGEKMFFEIVKAGFAHPRKKVISNLADIFGKEKIVELLACRSIGENVRAENLSLEDWLWLVEASELKNGG